MKGKKFDNVLVRAQACMNFLMHMRDHPHELNVSRKGRITHTSLIALRASLPDCVSTAVHCCCKRIPGAGFSVNSCRSPERRPCFRDARRKAPGISIAILPNADGSVAARSADYLRIRGSSFYADKREIIVLAQSGREKVQCRSRQERRQRHASTKERDPKIRAGRQGWHGEEPQAGHRHRPF